MHRLAAAEIEPVRSISRRSRSLGGSTSSTCTRCVGPPPPPLIGLDRLAAASAKPVLASIGVGSSSSEAIRAWSGSRAERCMSLDLGMRFLGAPGAGLFYRLAQIEERGRSHICDFAVAALPSTNVSRLGLGQRSTVLEQNTEIERRGRVAAFVRVHERRLGLG